MDYNKWRALVAGTACACLAASAGCGSDEDAGSGSLSVLLESEDVIASGIEAGDDVENIRDGWSLTFDKYLATVGHIDVHLSTDEDEVAEDDAIYVVDMKKVPSAGLPLWKLDGLREGRWEFFFETPGAGDGSKKHASVAQADYDAMVDGDFTYLLSGQLTKDDGQSCPPASLAKPGDKKPNGKTSGGNACYAASKVSFSFGAAAETSFGPCEIDEVPGFAITANAEQTVSATLHGDHLFFNGFPEGSEGGVMRLAQWLADCDLNLDGTVTKAELEAIKPSQLPELDDRYQLGGSPITPLDTMYDYVRSQLKTQGHMNGEGECPFDGMAHEHEHAHD